LLEAATLFPGRLPDPPQVNAVASPPEQALPRVDETVHGQGPGGSAFAPAGGLCVVPLLLAAGVIVAVGVAIRRAARGSAAVERVRIVAPPPGEAPEEIRRAWVGLEFSATASRSGSSPAVWGVLSNRPAGDCDGFAVEGAEAVRILATRDPDAGAWWHRHAPHVLAAGYQLVFPAEVCEHIS
jgi:hypothetical protein